MNKKQLRKELNRIQEVEQELNVRIDNLEKVNNELVEKINEQLEETKEIRRVQEQQGIDIAALAKAINNLEDKKMFFEDEFAEWEDRFNKISKFIEENPEFKGLGVIDQGALKQAMNDATKAIEIIDERLNRLQKLIKDIQRFDEFNYNNVKRYEQ